MADDTTDITPFQEPSSAKWLQLIGSMLGGNRGHLVGGALMGLGSMMDQNAYSKWEQATRPKELAMFQKHLNLSPDEMSYFGGLPTEMYQQLRPQLYSRLLAKPQGEGTPVKVSDNGVEGMYFPASGRTQWLSKGEDFYQPPKAQQPKGLTSDNLVLAKQLGFDADPGKWTGDQAKQFIRAKTALDLARRPTMNLNVEQPLSQADIMPPPAGMSAPGAVMFRDKSGRLSVRPSPIGPKAAATSKKSPKSPQDIIDAEMKNARQQWSDYQRYATSTASGWQKLRGIQLENPGTYAKRAAAVKLGGLGMLPPDIQSVDQRAKFTGRFDKLGNPIYQTSKGLMASESFGG